MVTTLPKTKPQMGRSGIGPGGNDFGGPEDDSGGNSRLPASAYKLGMWLALASILMLFMAFSSAYIIRQGVSGDWRPIPIPSLLWLTTAILIGSSVTLESSRRALKNGFESQFKSWLALTLVLGVCFLIGQFFAWRQLAGAGIYIATNPHSSFFYMLTGAHAVHILGGVIALILLVMRTWREPVFPSDNGFRRELAVDLTGIYWHFIDVLWIYLFILLFVWK